MEPELLNGAKIHIFAIVIMVLQVSSLSWINYISANISPNTR